MYSVDGGLGDGGYGGVRGFPHDAHAPEEPVLDVRLDPDLPGFMEGLHDPARHLQASFQNRTLCGYVLHGKKPRRDRDVHTAHVSPAGEGEKDAFGLSTSRWGPEADRGHGLTLRHRTGR